MTIFQRALPSTSRRRHAAAPSLASAPFSQTSVSVTSCSLSDRSKAQSSTIALQSQVCQKSTAKGSGDDHTEDVEESSAAFTFSRSVSLEEPDTPRLFLSAAQSQPRVLSSGVLMWDAMAFGSKVSKYVLLSCTK